MIINSIEKSNLNAVSFSKQEKKVNNAAQISKPIQDSFEKQNDMKPPVIDKSQNNMRKGGFILTDEQIAQINKTRTLPDNAIFFYISGNRQWRAPYYQIKLIDPKDGRDSHVKKHGTRHLPEDFVVVRKSNGVAEALLIKKD